MTHESLPMWVIYDRPRDYPDHVVVRKWLVREQAEPTPCTLHDSIEAARAALPPGLVCLPRDPHDDPFIVETWL